MICVKFFLPIYHDFPWACPTIFHRFSHIFPIFFPFKPPFFIPPAPGGLLQKRRRLGARGGGARGARRGVFLGRPKGRVFPMKITCFRSWMRIWWWSFRIFDHFPRWSWMVEVKIRMMNYSRIWSPWVSFRTTFWGVAVTCGNLHIQHDLWWTLWFMRCRTLFWWRAVYIGLSSCCFLCTTRTQKAQCQ